MSRPELTADEVIEASNTARRRRPLVGDIFAGFEADWLPVGSAILLVETHLGRHVRPRSALVKLRDGWVGSDCPNPSRVQREAKFRVLYVGTGLA